MSILDQLMSRQKKEVCQSWKVLGSLGQLDEIIDTSHSRPVVVFKHSVRCGISAMVKYQLEKGWDFQEDELDFYYLDIFQFRNISNEIRDRFNIVHQSPQIIIFNKGEVIYHTSHHMISLDIIREQIGPHS